MRCQEQLALPLISSIGCDNEEVAVEQLVLQKQCKKTVLKLAHSIPLAGHLGRDKTMKRLPIGLLSIGMWLSMVVDMMHARE